MIYIKPTPEEQAKRTAKSLATRRANIEKRNAENKNAYAKRFFLQNEIEKLESKLKNLQAIDTMQELSNKVCKSVLLQEQDILLVAKPWMSFCGVYFLISDDEVVYVGQSVNVYARIAQHKNKKFDKFAVLACSSQQLNVIESLYIHMLKPILNGSANHNNAPISFSKICEMASIGRVVG